MSARTNNERVFTIGDRGKRVWLYPSIVWGKMLRRRQWVHLVLVVLLLLGPWIDIAGNPAMRFDIPGRRIYFWGLTFFATDGAYLLFFLLNFIFIVFLATALFGRAWCGWACPQTVFLEGVIRPVERFFEGNASARKRLDRGPWNFDKILAKAGKFGTFLLICGGIGTTFVAYFLGREGVMMAQADPWSHPSGTLIFIAITAATFFDFAWFREQLCVVACPYGRFQSVLLDSDSLAVGYDRRRGEARESTEADGKAEPGDCVNCRRCVQVCPTGIDIRLGTQMECIQCMSCIDACDHVMIKLKRPTGLVRLTSERALAGKRSRILRPRVIAYALGLALTSSTMLVAFAEHEPLTYHLGRQAQAPYHQLPSGEIRNSLKLRISNRDRRAHSFELRLLSPEGAKLILPTQTLRVEADSVEQFPFFVVHGATGASHEMLRLELTEGTDSAEVFEFNFLRPSSKADLP